MGDGGEVLVRWLSRDGEEREERWASLERFRAWAAAEGGAGEFTAYAEDDDGEWVVVAKGRFGG